MSVPALRERGNQERGEVVTIPKNFISPEHRLLLEIYGLPARYGLLSLEERYRMEARGKPEHYCQRAYEQACGLG